MSLFKKVLSDKRQKVLQNRILEIEKINQELMEENKKLQLQIESYQNQIYAFSDLEKLYKDCISEIKKIKIDYENTIREANEIKIKYSKKMRDLIKQFKREF